MSKRVLLIGRWWGGNSATYRRPGLDRYLPEFGWEPVVLGWPLPAGVELPCRVAAVGASSEAREGEANATSEGKGTRVRVARHLHLSPDDPALRWAFTRARELIEYPDGYAAWRREALSRGLDLAREEHFDAVISSSTPISTHLVAAQLKRRHGMFWVADFPHLWSQDHGVPYGRVRRWFDRRLELRTLADADVLTTINPPLAHQFETLHGAGRVVPIEHGFDPETLNTGPDAVTKEFTITYTGGWSRGLREPRMILYVLKRLLDAGVIDRARLSVRFYGPPEQWVQDQIEEAGMGDVATQYGRVPQPEAFARQRESQVLLIPKSELALEGMISSKFYEYLAARRPILALGGHPDVVDEKLAATGAGVACGSCEEAMAALSSYYQEYATTGVVTCRSDMDAVMKYSQREMARQFAELLAKSK